MKGFSLIELVITLAIIVVVASVGFLSLANYSSRRNITLSTDEVIAVIRDTQNRSITQEDGKKWGIRFTNSTSNPHNYEVFKGTSYASGTVSKFYSFRRNVTFTDPNDNVNVDILFSQITGVPNTSGIIITLTDGTYYGDILMRSNGAISDLISSDLVGYWKFDENTGTSTVDSSNNSNAGTLTNSPTWQSGTNCKQGACLSFDGSNDYVDIGNDSTLDPGGNDFTISAWIKASDKTNVRRIIMGSAGAKRFIFRIGNTSDGESKTYFEIDDNTPLKSVVGDTVIDDNNWHHVIGVRDGNNLRVYVDGTEDATPTDITGYGSITNTDNKFIGTINNTPNTPFDGSIDDVRFYESALSATEVSDLYDFSK